MVNNAGISIEATDPQPIHLVSEHTWDLTMRVNVKSVFLGCKYAVAQMLKQDELPCGSRGWIINLSSIYGLVSIEKTGALLVENVGTIINSIKQRLIARRKEQ